MYRLTIGQMSKINNVSEQTLRYYDKIGILKPIEVDKFTGYRYYSMKQCARLDMIQYLKSLGMRLKDIEVQLKTCDTKLIKRFLEEKNRSIDSEIEALKNQKNALQRAVRNYERYETSPPDGTIALEYIEKRWIYSYNMSTNFYDYGIEIYEEQLRKLKEDMERNGLRQTYFCNAGSTVAYEQIVNRDFISCDLFVFVDENVPEALIRTIKAGTYLCIYCSRFEQEIPYANKLLDEISERNYTIDGDYICEVITDLPDLMDGERGMFFKLQIPVKIT
ncbi:MAG TPA: MerR family transcriptional regulator [Clostridiales bacterium]|jgi:DNA-binding transcriptional MerR regulator|nr:MerR family transcriptional regulator [Clostridiales bacterium]HCS11984.1 MerR family transcriptional regulator [Clostridiales bacterium]